MRDVSIFYGHLVYLKAILHTCWSFDNIFFPFWYVVPWKILQPWIGLLFCKRLFLNSNILKWISVQASRNASSSAEVSLACKWQLKLKVAGSSSTVPCFFLRICLLRNAPAGNHQLVADDLMADGTISRISNADSLRQGRRQPLTLEVKELQFVIVIVMWRRN
jgi:hypothetical protein